MPRRRNIPEGIRPETKEGTGIEVRVVQECRPQAAAVGVVGKIVIEVGADYLKEREDVSVDDKKLWELGILRPKKRNNDICLGVKLSRE